MNKMKRLEKIVVATRNPGKKERYGRLLSRVAKEVLSLADLGIKEKPQESGETAEENAKIKAIFYAKLTGLLVFSEDESLFVDFLPLDKQPGVYIRRVDGKEEVDDNQLLAHWEKIIAKVPKEKRTGRWHTAYCLAAPIGKVSIVSTDHHRMFFYPSSKIRIPGWPMSSLQGPIEAGKPHSELTRKELKQFEREADRIILKKLTVMVRR